MKKITKNLTFTFVIIVVFAIVVELLFRWVEGPPLGPQTKIAKRVNNAEGHRLLGDIDQVFAGKNVKTNELGLRENTAPHKSESPVQIMILGDSFTFGIGVKEEASFPSQLEKKLSSDNYQVEVINAGVPGYDTVQELALFKRILPYYSPKWVLVAFHTSDLAFGGKNKKVPLTLKLREFLRYRSSFFSWFYRIYKTRLIKFVPPPKGLLTFDPDRFQNSPQFAESKKAFLQIKSICDENKIKMGIFMVVPLIAFNNYPYHKLHAGLKRFAENNGITYIDPFHAFSRYDAADLWVAPNDGHYNSKGNEIAAEVLTDFFAAKL